MTIYDSFFVYRDSWGLNQVEPAATSQNGTLFTVEYLISLRSNKAPRLASEVARVFDVFKGCTPYPGLSIRYPGSSEFDSMDNNVALLVFYYLFLGSNYYADRMTLHGATISCGGVDTLQAGEKNKKYYWLAWLVSLGRPKNYWNNQRPNLFCFDGWYGRSPGFMGILSIAATNTTSTYRSLALAIGQFLPLLDKKGETSGIKLSYLVYQMLLKHSWKWKLDYWIWKKLLRLKYKGGMKEVYEIYYGQHPIVEYCND